MCARERERVESLIEREREREREAHLCWGLGRVLRLLCKGSERRR